MVNQINNSTGEINEQTSGHALSTISQPPTSQRTRSRENLSNEDLILSLSNAYENKRARQVTEWERLHSQNIYRTA